MIPDPRSEPQEFAKYVSQFVGIPYKDRATGFDGSDCWGIVALYLQHAAHIVLPDFVEVSVRTPSEEIERIAEMQASWSLASPPYQPFDVMLFRVGKTLHAGVVIDYAGNMLNSNKGTDSIVVSLGHSMWQRTMIGAYRHHSFA